MRSHQFAGRLSCRCHGLGPGQQPDTNDCGQSWNADFHQRASGQSAFRERRHTYRKLVRRRLWRLFLPAYGYEFNVSARNPSRGVFALDWPAYSGAIYKVLSTTNLSVPRTNWTVVATITNSLDAATLSFTNANATNQDRFYQIIGP